jgi:hypothetical protein
LNQGVRIMDEEIKMSPENGQSGNAREEEERWHDEFLTVVLDYAWKPGPAPAKK